MSLINTEVQPFKVQAFHNGKFVEITEASLKGKWSVLIFMPAAFTFNCPTESYGQIIMSGFKNQLRWFRSRLEFSKVHTRRGSNLIATCGGYLATAGTSTIRTSLCTRMRAH